MADQAKGKGIAPKRASNPADLGQSSRPLPPIRTLSEDEEDGEDYSEVIEVLKQHIKSYKRDSVSAIKNISSTLASLTNSSNAAAATIGKTSYSPRFDPFSGTIDLDSPPRPPRKEPYLGPAVNSATSNLDPPIDTGSKEGFKDTITSSIVKELSKKAYTIPDDSKLSRESNFEQWIQALSIVLRALGISNFLENPDISNTYSDSDQAVLLMLLRDSLSSSPRAAISRPIESKKEDVYNEFHALTFSTYKKGLSAFNAEFNGYLAKLTIAKIDIVSIRSHCTNIDFLSNLDNSVYNIPAPTPAKPAKITPAIRCTAAYKAKQRKLAKACAAAGRAAAAKRPNKDDNNVYNRAYMPSADIKKEEGSSSNNDGVNSSTSDSADKGKGSGAYKRGKGTLYYKDILLYKRQRVASYPYSPPSTPYTNIYIYYV
ncbi:hypothetical protein P8C59_006407 [Phyllachora maydis]|uniref:Uncharacterized protein n=1 Tax=Phyllachora maydis TaxID=1825666 RepID=A0AAD9MEI3_9PEZI|nr:hypothetical protein P8C59_006407 [Phyllachora maydis]